MDSIELQLGFYYFLALLISLVLHELAHGGIALWLGDSTAKNQGRLTLDPRAHLDPLGFLMLLMLAFYHIGFGWAKPVPVNPRHFKDPRRGFGLVALAGPFMNLLLALSVYWMYLILAKMNVMLDSLDIFLQVWVHVNLGLAVFNLIPLYPLDGQKVLSALLPADIALAYDSFSIKLGAWPLMILVVLEWILPGMGPLGYIFNRLMPFFEDLLLYSSAWLT